MTLQMYPTMYRGVLVKALLNWTEIKRIDQSSEMNPRVRHVAWT